MSFSPEAPDEIWLNIFWHGTGTSGTTLEGYPIASKTPAVSESRNSLAQKSKLALVCRRWNQMATPLLYEDVSLNDEKQLTMLSKTLIPPASSLNHPRSSELCGLVRRLNLFFRFDMMESPGTNAWLSTLRTAFNGQHSQARLGRIASLCRALVNLTSFWAQLDFDVVDPFVLLRAMPADLERLHWMSFYGTFMERGISLSLVLQFMQDHQKLTSFAMPFTFDDSPLTTAQLAGQALSSVQEWVIQVPLVPGSWADAVTMADLPSGALPNLQSLRILHESWSLDDTYRSIISAHGKRLTSIGLVLNDVNSFFLCELLQHVASCCPSIREVNFLLLVDTSEQGAGSIARWIDRAMKNHQFDMPTINTLVLSFDRSSDMRDTRWFTTLPWEVMFPQVQTLRVVLDSEVIRHRQYDVDLRYILLCSLIPSPEQYA